MSSTSLRVRSDLTYTIGVTTGQNPVQGASVSDVLPNGVTLLGATTSTGSCQVAAAVVCKLGDLPAGDFETITLKVHANAAGDLTDSAALSTTSADPNPSNNSASVVSTVFSPCAAPGVTLTDPTGDELDQQPAHDIQSISLAEPAGPNKLLFTLKVASLSSVPPDTTWPVSFVYGKDATGAPQEWFVAMQTSATGAVSFVYGLGQGGTTSLGTLDAGSGFTPDGTITLVISNSKIAPASGGTPSAGQQLSAFLTRVRVEVRQARL